MFNILVVEDTTDMRELFCTVLSDGGYIKILVVVCCVLASILFSFVLLDVLNGSVGFCAIDRRANFWARRLSLPLFYRSSCCFCLSTNLFFVQKICSR